MDAKSPAFIHVVAVKDVPDNVQKNIKHTLLQFLHRVTNCKDTKVDSFKKSTCPIKKDDKVTYTLGVNLNKPADSLFDIPEDKTFYINFNFFGRNGKLLMCAQIPAKFQEEDA